MAVEARHLNLFPSHLLCSREMLNPATENVAQNLHNNPAGMAVPPATDSPLPLYGSQFGDAVMQRLSKTMNNNRVVNLPLKDDNNAALPFTRKRPREAVNALGNRNGNNASVSVPNGKVGGGAASFSFLGQDLSLQMMQQQLDLDRLVSLQMDKIRLEIEERHRKESRRLFGTIDEAVSKKLREKEEQIERIGKLNFALEERAKSLYLENQIWRDLAQTHEATATALRSNLELVLAQANNNNNADGVRSGDDDNDDAESCCGSSGEDDRGDEAEGDGVLRWRKVAGGERKEGEGEMKKRMCRRCGETESSVLVLPCRHLCLCSACGPSVDTCPICNSTKNASLHVNFS